MTGGPADDDFVEQFSKDLTRALRLQSGRALAAKTHWGRTTVNEIKSGARLPSERQLADLLGGAGFDKDAVQGWVARYLNLGESSEASAQSEPVGQIDQAPSPEPVLALTRVSDTDGVPVPSRRRLWPFVAGAALILAVAVSMLASSHRSTPAVPVAEPSGTTGPTTMASPTPTPTRPVPSGSISRPEDGATAGASAGLKLYGRATDVAAGTVWLLDRDADGSYAADSSVDLSDSGDWTAEDAPIGDPDDLPSQINILLVYAGDSCAAFLRAKADADDSTFGRIPRGCQILDRVNVTVNRP